MSGVRLVLSDVDGTLITPDKTLTKSAIRAVHELGDAGIIFAITSARPPQGLAMFVEPLNHGPRRFLETLSLLFVEIHIKLQFRRITTGSNSLIVQPLSSGSS